MSCRILANLAKPCENEDEDVEIAGKLFSVTCDEEGAPKKARIE